MRTIGIKYLNPLELLDFYVRFSTILRIYDVAPIPFRYLRVWEPMALLVDVDVVQEQQERQFHRQHVSFDILTPWMKNFPTSRGSKSRQQEFQRSVAPPARQIQTAAILITAVNAALGI